MPEQHCHVARAVSRSRKEFKETASLLTLQLFLQVLYAQHCNSERSRHPPALRDVRCDCRSYVTHHMSDKDVIRRRMLILSQVHLRCKKVDSAISSYALFHHSSATGVCTKCKGQ